MKTMMLAAGIASTLALMTTQPSNAQMNGPEIMDKVYRNPTGDDMQGQLTMVLVNKQGEKRERTMKQYLKNDEKTEKKIMFFLAPADVKNTSFMNWSYNDGHDDDQWIYLPALRRTKRISSDGKGDYFMGSDFTYDDLGDRHPEEDHHTLLREELVENKSCYVVESKPKDPDDMYSKTITWVMKDNFLGLQKEFYDEDGDLLKILSIKRFEKISGYWTILETEMKNVQKDHATRMTFSDIKINQGLSDAQFTERSMTLGL